MSELFRAEVVGGAWTSGLETEVQLESTLIDRLGLNCPNWSFQA